MTGSGSLVIMFRCRARDCAHCMCFALGGAGTGTSDVGEPGSSFVVALMEQPAPTGPDTWESGARQNV